MSFVNPIHSSGSATSLQELAVEHECKICQSEESGEPLIHVKACCSFSIHPSCWEKHASRKCPSCSDKEIPRDILPRPEDPTKDQMTYKIVAGIFCLCGLCMAFALGMTFSYKRG